MVTYNYPLIAREGWPLIMVVTVVAIFIHLNFSLYAAIPFWMVVLVLCFMYRDPARSVPPKPLAVVSPVDGKIVEINTVEDPCLNRNVIRIQLLMHWFSIFSTRSPMEGKVIKQWFGKNAFINAGRKDNNSQPVAKRIVPAAEKNARHFAQWIQSDESDDVVMSLDPNVSFVRPLCYVRGGERVGQGQRCGIIPFGARVNIYVPQDSVLEVKLGDHVRAGSDTLATLVH